MLLKTIVKLIYGPFLPISWDMFEIMQNCFLLLPNHRIKRSIDTQKLNFYTVLKNLWLALILEIIHLAFPILEFEVNKKFLEDFNHLGLKLFWLFHIIFGSIFWTVQIPVLTGRWWFQGNRHVYCIRFDGFSDAQGIELIYNQNK